MEMQESGSSSSSESEDNFELNPLLRQISSDSSESDDELLEEIGRRTRHVRNFRERPDNLNEWNELEFFVRFRLTKNSVILLLEKIGHELRTPTLRNVAVSPINQLLLALRFYATGNMLITAGDFSGVHKSTAYRIIVRVTNAIAALAGDYISMPKNQQEVREKQNDFFNIARFPKVVGAIDCTHIKIQSPGNENAEYFRNRKGYFSLNVQVIGDAKLRILDLAARWPGSSHDQTIFNNSYIQARLEADEFQDSVVMGDSAYALKKYLITPLQNPTNRAEQLFNQSQIRSRNPIERLFGVWKRRFPILSLGIRLTLATTQAIIIATAVLHNIALEKLEEVPPQDPDLQINPEEEEIPDNLHIDEPRENINFRVPFIAYFADLL